ncbi:MAG: hypothetical protein ACI4ED_05215 [Suilimivivens sp.]
MGDRQVNLKGEVVEEVSLNEHTGSFVIRTEDRNVRIISEGEQAIKDYMFIRKNQKMEIDGTEREDKVYSRKLRIDILK